MYAGGRADMEVGRGSPAPSKSTGHMQCKQHMDSDTACAG